MGKRTLENTSFRCLHCQAEVPLLTQGSYRNHCPFCLHSCHVDNIPGDRACHCHGLMKPIKVRKAGGKKGFQILHRCLQCNYEGWNKAALNDPCSDDVVLLAELLNK